MIQTKVLVITTLIAAVVVVMAAPSVIARPIYAPGPPSSHCRCEQVTVNFNDKNAILGNYNNAYADNIALEVGDHSLSLESHPGPHHP